MKFKTDFRSIFVSDCHLMSPDSQHHKLLYFLKHCKCSNLYLVGDIIDFWFLKRNMVWPEKYYNIGREIIKMAKYGTKIIYIPGNHDEFFRPFCDQQWGNFMICDHYIHVGADNKRYLVVHGDVFDHITLNYRWLSDLGSLGYALLTKLNKIFNWILGGSRKSVSSTVKRKIKNWLEFVTRFEKNAVLMAKAKEMDGVICGHSHYAAKHAIDGIIYMNCGDWLEHCSYICEHEDGTFTLEYVDQLNARKDVFNGPKNSRSKFSS